MRQQYQMTQEQLDKLLDSIKHSPSDMSGTPQSQQERADAALEALGKEMGFKHMTVQPTGRSDLFFTAEPADDSL